LPWGSLVMSNFALANDFSSNPRRTRVVRRPALRVVRTSWLDLPVVRAQTGAPQRRGPKVAAVALFAALVVAVHVSGVWYAAHHVSTGLAPLKHEVAVEIVAPPKPPPPPPKVEPPKKPPPPRQVKQQVLPQIQTAVPDTPVVDSGPAVPAEPVAPVAPPPPPEPEKITAPFGRAGYLNNPPPAYPPAAARQGWQGTVLLKVRVLSTGKVESAEVQKSSGFKLLDEEAKTTVLTWTFTPSKRGATPIDGWATVPIEFKLDN
jgi:protein TonB